jgi:hypothetical protein
VQALLKDSSVIQLKNHLLYQLATEYFVYWSYAVQNGLYGPIMFLLFIATLILYIQDGLSQITQSVYHR